MSHIVVKRPPRTLPPPVDGEDLPLEPPPELPREQQEGVLMQLLPTLGMAGSAPFFFFMPNAHPFMRVMGVLMLLSTVGMVIAMLVRHRRGTQGQLAQLRRDYLKYLAQTRRRVRRTAKGQRDAQFYLHPAPGQLWALVAEGSRVWERRPVDGDFGQVRVGLGTQRLATALVTPETAPVDELEPLTAGAMHQFVNVHGTLSGLPLAVSLRAFYHLTLSGRPDSVHDSARALVCSLAALHSPDDLVIAVGAGPGAVERWEWVKWLPHAQDPGALDGAGSRRLISDDVGELEAALASRLEGRPRFSAGGPPVVEQPHVLLLLDGASVPPTSLLAGAEGLQGVTVAEIVPGEIDRDRGGLSVVVRPGELSLASGHGMVYEGTPDALSPEEAEALARQLAPLRMGSGGGAADEPLLANLEFTDLLGLGDAATVDVNRTWRPRAQAQRLRVPIGVGEGGSPVMLDLKEAAQDGMGPHGLCVGATGSGKSELLRTLVLGLAVTHSSETLNFVLADFKGGATFAGMADMPHVAAVITNLADDLTLVDRMGDSIRGELNRRQEMLRDAGNYANIHDYEKARAAGAPLAPVPSLVLVIDEFSELLSAKPDFIDMFIQIGRIGRSLGVHLLLASQRLEEGRLRGLETYLSYRIGLRTFSAAESRAALDVPDAFHLPSVPGSGLLKFGTEELTRFKAAYVSGVYRSPAESGHAPAGPAPARRQPVLFTAAPVPLPRPEPADDRGVPAPGAPPEDDALADTVLDVVVRRLEGQGAPAHQVWLPPLDSPPTLDELLPGLGEFEGLGFTQPEADRPARLTIPLGVVDKPFEQRRDVLHSDFSGAAGHMLVLGGPRSGKSTLLRTLITAFALTHTPREVQFYGLDFGGGGMVSVAGLPHVGGVASRLDPERVRRTVAEVAGVLARREEFFRTEGVDSMDTYRRRRAQGQFSGQQFGDVFLVIDGWGSFRQDYDELHEVVTDLAARGLGYGVHVVVSASRSMEVRANLKDQLMNRLELRLGDTLDSELDRKVAANVPAGMPGRGQSPGKLHFMAAVPRADGTPSDDNLSEATEALVRSVSDAWPHQPAPPVRLLPRHIPAEELPRGGEFPERGVAFGLDERNLAPVHVDFETDPFFLVFGESESGKSAVLRLLARQIADRYTPQEARIVAIDYRRGLLDGLPKDHLLVYAPTSSGMEDHMGAVRDLMVARTPPTDITPQQLRERSWWSGPRMFLLVDDYELVSASSGNPLDVLIDQLPYARDIGVHLIVARNANGASRSTYEPFMRTVRELGAQGLILSGDPMEGELLGNVRPRPMPPGRGAFVSRKRGVPLVQTGWWPGA
ncbi:type VII secretion protein EccCa [Streptomyces sp. AJS327]|uniref:type VII secretion protein EccCa n=1 Tax=Streptomyces sp. AJS327 TaxID=2545265 RepID=UPI0015E01026|nr:type VII secretion protein EccCa [Streptomyces sp. AJS327]MBA0051891.1 type VII secretion protein EccCa [Streptomyces sp. AJS327]